MTRATAMAMALALFALLLGWSAAGTAAPSKGPAVSNTLYLFEKDKNDTSACAGK